MVSAFFKSSCLRFLPVVFALATVASAQSKAPAGPLPQTFSGWWIDAESVKSSKDPAAADATDAPVLKEYGFTDMESGTYSRNGRKMQIKTARFTDATGAFGAFTYYVQPQMQAEKIGDRGASSNTRILFFKGNILVDVSVEHLSAMSGADLRSLADALPRLTNENGKLPTLLANLPTQSLQRNTSRYII